jgi:glutamate formiminotransferase/formiminotetrahydrofolate cyclodeaminase
VIGARPFLIAYNVYLTTEDVNAAKHIARAVRHSSGGLRYVKALGLEVDGQAQVSMNLTEYRKTPLARVVELIRREAARYGVAVHHSELVGLIPQEALIDAAVWYLQLDQFEKDQVLETKLAGVSKDTGSQMSLVDQRFLESLAAGTPAPGGGSAAAYAGAMAAALLAMVARVTIGKKKYASVEDRMKEIEQRAESLRAELSAAVDEDAAAFEGVMAAYRLPKDDPESETRRTEAIEAATLHAAQVPLNVARKAEEILQISGDVVVYGNINAISDAGSAAALAGACLNGAALNVRINAAALGESEESRKLVSLIEEIEVNANGLLETVRSRIAERGGLTY